MEPLKSVAGIEAAMRAALQTSRSSIEKTSQEKDKETNTCLSIMMGWPATFLREKMIPFYRNSRAKAKVHVEHLLYGNNPYSCKIRTTGINLLVACSFVYLFLEAISLAFLDPQADFALAIVGV